MTVPTTEPTTGAALPGTSLHNPVLSNPALHNLARDVGRGLQLSRSSALALTRLQLALKTGDQRQALDALDRLHAVDSELEQLVEGLPRPPLDGESAAAPDGPAPESLPDAALARQLEHQKRALASERLALASGVSGPDLVSQPLPDFGPSRARAEPEPAPPRHRGRVASDWSYFAADRPRDWRGEPLWFVALLLAIVAMIALGATATAMPWR